MYNECSHSFQIAYFMHIGMRDNQEDCIYINGKVVQEADFDKAYCEQIQDNSVIAAVCDGMGGLQCGEQASRFVCESLREKLHNLHGMESSIVSILKEIQWDFERMDMGNTGTTIAGIVIEKGITTVFNAGDSRVYRLGPEGIVYLSHDHSFVQKQIDQGRLTEDEAFIHPYRNIIEFGMGTVFTPEWDKGNRDIFVAHDIVGTDDFYLICSDGVSDILRDREIYDILYPDPFDRLPYFIDNLSDKMKDNISFILIGNRGAT